ncbi:nucleoside monophosphate kinase [Candidatus Saccharibacteria bacterium]|nr:nucleoside monophosphate kinase [Candidatus Saccharibacteria bacterium]
MDTQSDEAVEHIKDWLGCGSINIFGLPFAGKDTHGRELAELLGAQLIGGGEIIRSKITPQHMKDHIAEGKLTPTDEYLALMLPYFEQERLKDLPLVLSSVGRWFGEQTHVMNAAQASGHPLKAVLFLDITVTELYKRWEASLKIQDRGKRHDDAEHILETRIEEFQTKTLPVIDYYRNEGLLIPISSEGTQAETLTTILNELGTYSKKATNVEPVSQNL